MIGLKHNSINSFTSRKIAMGLEGPRQVMVLNSIEAISHLSFPFKLKTLISIVCIKGELTVLVDVDEYVLTESSIMALRPGHMLNGYRASSDFKGCLIMAPLHSLNHSLPSFSRLLSCFLYFRERPVIKITPAELEIQQYLHAVITRKQAEARTPYYDNVLDALYQSVLYETLSIYTALMDREQEGSDGKLRRKEEVFYNFLLLVEANFKSERSVHFYADKLNITPKHLSAVAKETSGHTAGEWIDSYVILEAKMLLNNSELSVQEISARLNFANQSFFGKYFKHHTGMSPRACRSSLLSE